MTALSMLEALLSRVEAGEGEDHALDLDLCVHLKWIGERAHFTNLRASDRFRGWLEWDEGNELCFDMPPRLTGSLDAAVTFAAAFGERPEDLIVEAIQGMIRVGYPLDKPRTPQMARAILSDLLRALIAQAREVST